MLNHKSIKKLTNQYKSVEKIRAGILFNDIYFPPNDKSIYSTNPIYSEKNNEHPQSFLLIDDEFSKSQYMSLPKDIKYSWRSISLSIKDFNIIKNINLALPLEDIIQGDIGNSYFFSGLKFLAEEPERIISLFNNFENKKEKKNFFEINVYINGYKSKIIIDDKFPYIPNSENEFTFCRYNKKTNNIWPMILEKVWAKVNSTYEDTIRGNISDIFLFFSPCPFKLYHHDIKYKNLFEKITNAIDKNFIVCADMVSNNENVLLKKLGVLSNHAYRVIGYGTVLDSNGNKYNLIKIHNKFQITKWMGNWSPDSNKWTSEFKKHLNYDPNSDNDVYYMDINDYLKYYSTTYILSWHKQYSYYSEKINISGINEAFTCCKITFNDINIINQSNSNDITYFIVNSKNKRIQQNFKNKRNFSNIFKNIFLFKIEEKDNWILIDSICGKDERISLEINNNLIKEGDEFILFISFPYLDKENNFELKKNFSINPERPNNICVAIYTNICNRNNDIDNNKNQNLINKKCILIEQIKNNNEKFEKIIIKSIYEKSKLNSHLYYFDKERENDSSRSINFENEKGAYGYLVIDNRSPGILYEKLTLNEYENINIFYIIKSLNKKKNSFNSDYSSSNKEIKEDLIDDKNTREIINYLIDEKYTNSYENTKINILPTKNIKEKGENSTYEILLKVGAKSVLILIFEKCDEFSAIDIRSQIVFKYPLYMIISEKKNNSINVNRLEYKYNKIEIYENIIEHNTGVIFYYMNKENKLKAKINIIFKNLKNLEIELTSDQLKNKNDINIYKDNNNTIIIELNLYCLTNNFFSLKTKNIFDNFSYTFEMKYSIFY